VESNAKIIRFVTILTVVVAGVLTLLREVTNPLAQRNEEIFNKRAVLSAIVSKMGDGTKTIDDFSDDEVLEIFKTKIEQKVIKADGSEVEGVLAEKIDMAKEKKKPESERLYPLFIYKNGDEVYYILAVRGNGLWDEIWGYIALASDKNTVVGASFDHKGETPGLGAEIKDNPKFRAQFVGKKVYEDDGDYVSVLVKKAGTARPGNLHEVDGISGATITSVGVSKMLENGIKAYDAYLKKLK